MTRGAKRSITVAAGVTNEIEKAGPEVTAKYKWVRVHGCYPGGGGETGTTEAITDPGCHVERCMKL